MRHPSLNAIRHSLAHLLAHAVKGEFPEAKFAIGPTIENGFYYDFDLPRQLTADDLPKLEERMRQLIARGLPFEKLEPDAPAAKASLKDQPFKRELIDDLKKEKATITFYQVGDFTDLCRGGHVTNTKDIPVDGFKLDSIAGAYWRGSEKNPMLTRVYGLAFGSKKELEGYLTRRAEAAKRDHKKLGPELDLFVFSDLVGSGLPLWTPSGTLLRILLDEFVWELRRTRGYERVEIPHITKRDLFERSGHWEKFKDELFRIRTREGHEFAMKPMNCPHHTQLYARKAWSYRDLPQRYANTTMCYRDEQSGELAGLSRARSFTQDDAHVFCRMAQAKDELLAIWDIVNAFYQAFGFTLQVRLSLHDPAHPEKYLGDAKHWELAESTLRAVVTKRSAKTFEAVGEAAFYGPKLDFLAEDSMGREWQVATIQLDVNMPERFDLTCTNEQGKHERIVMIHAAIMGSIERFLAVLIEHLAGAFPLWLSPIQVAVIPVGSRHVPAAQKLGQEFREAGLRVEVDAANETVGNKIRKAAQLKIPYLLVLGDKELKEPRLVVRKRGEEGLLTVAKSSFLERLRTAVAERSLKLP